MISFNLPNPLTEQNSISYHRQRGCLETANPAGRQTLNPAANPAPAGAPRRGGRGGCEDAGRNPGAVSPSNLPQSPGEILGLRVPSLLSGNLPLPRSY